MYFTTGNKAPQPSRVRGNTPEGIQHQGKLPPPKEEVEYFYDFTGMREAYGGQVQRLHKPPTREPILLSKTPINMNILQGQDSRRVSGL